MWTKFLLAACMLASMSLQAATEMLKPEPATFLVLGVGLLGVSVLLRRRRL